MFNGGVFPHNTQTHARSQKLFQGDAALMLITNDLIPRRQCFHCATACVYQWQTASPLKLPFP